VNFFQFQKILASSEEIMNFGTDVRYNILTYLLIYNSYLNKETQ